MIELIYCAAGNKRFASIARRYGLSYGAQLPNTTYFPVEFADQNWKKPNRTRYMQALEHHRPRLATILDWEQPEQFEEVMSWAHEAAQYVETVIVIPKVMGEIGRIPDTINGKPIRLGYSVPTKFAGTELPVWEFERREVHLLGGSPMAQKKLSRYLNVKSADGNYIQKMATMKTMAFMAQKGQFQNGHFPQLQEIGLGESGHDAPAYAIEISVMNMQAYWQDAPCLLRPALATDIESIVKIARQYRTELGYVMIPALRESIARRTLVVAVSLNRVVGFVNYRACRDGWQTIYEIAVHKDFARQGVGQALLCGVPRPIRLKCPVDNASNAFYEAMGFCFHERVAGRKRELNVWRKEQVLA